MPKKGHTHTHALARTRTHSHSHALALTRTHSRALARTHACTHAHTYYVISERFSDSFDIIPPHQTKRWSECVTGAFESLGNRIMSRRFQNGDLSEYEDNELFARRADQVPQTPSTSRPNMQLTFGNMAFSLWGSDDRFSRRANIDHNTL